MIKVQLSRLHFTPTAAPARGFTAQVLALNVLFIYFIYSVLTWPTSLTQQTCFCGKARAFPPPAGILVFWGNKSRASRPWERKTRRVRLAPERGEARMRDDNDVLVLNTVVTSL